MFIFTLISVLGLINLGYFLLLFSAGQYVDICTYSVSYLYYPGIAGVCIAFLAGVIAMW